MLRRRVALVVLVITALAGLITAGAWASAVSGATGMMGARGSGAGMMSGHGMMGGGSGGDMMGGYVLPGNDVRVDSLDAARRRAQASADRWGLRVGEVMRFDNGFYAELQTTDGQGASEVLIDQAGGSVRLEFGPAMMWNTSYGMHGGPAATTTRVSRAEAVDIAQRWLNDQRPELSAGDPEQFPGYYTLHTTRGGKISGMMSVNAYTGAVWYHTWHGRYIAMSEG